VTDALQFRLILHDRASGRRNMAVDHALLDGVSRPGARPVLRLYGFAPPALSLGRFQRAGEIVDLEAVSRDGIDVVRRPSGGQAVLHDGSSPTPPSSAGGTSSPSPSARHIASLPASSSGRSPGSASISAPPASGARPPQPRLLPDHGEYELADLRGRKLVGSAQMVTREGTLQHGAIPLDESNRSIARYLRASGAQETHDSASVSSLLGRPAAFDWFRDELARSLAATVHVMPDELDPFERERADRRLEELYGSDRWNLEP